MNKIDRVILIILHEFTHLKIGYYYNNQLFYKRSPKKIHDEIIKECGYWVEEFFFGGVINMDKVSDDIAKIIVPVKNY